MKVMDPDFLGALIDRHSAALVLYARQWCATPEDVVQESFLKLVKQAEPPLQPVAWLYRVVRNGAISQARAARRRQNHESRAAERAAAWFIPPDDPTGLDVARVTAALGELPG